MSDLHLLSDYQALLAAVRADPTNDLPRLVFADWFDDRGAAERAAFVRVQIAIVAESSRPFSQAEMTAQQFGRLIATPTTIPPAGWVVESVLGPGSGCSGWVRGFIESVTCPAAAWVAHGDDMLAREPVRAVRLTTVEVDWPTDDEWQAAYTTAGVTEECYFGGGEDQAGPVHRAMFAARWPGVEFELPPADDAYTRFIAQQRAAIYDAVAGRYQQAAGLSAGLRLPGLTPIPPEGRG